MPKFISSVAVYNFAMYDGIMALVRQLQHTQRNLVSHLITTATRPEKEDLNLQQLTHGV